MISRVRRLLTRSAEAGIDRWIASVLGRAVVARMQVHATQLPDYRFVDLFRAIERWCDARGGAVSVESEHGEDLNNILHGPVPSWSPREIKGTSKVPWPTGPGEEVFLPLETFWVCHGRSAPDGRSVIVRLRHEKSESAAIVEAASDDADVAEQSVTAIVDDAAAQSIYRNRLLELTYDSPGRMERADLSTGRLRVGFKALEAVDDGDIVIDDDVRRMLSRNVLDLYRRRDLLKRHGVPVRRGTLLFGPPGTGKTFACRFLCSQLPDTTRIVATGTALFQVGAIFLLARLLQPSLVILEDVDLVFADREINLYSSALGDLLDHMDGLRPHEDIAFILTTNAIERLESAIKDRPGRISQIINFGPPGPQLRRRYLQHHLRAYDLGDVDLDRLAAISVGGTQAFLKEWVHRAIQVATERLATDDDALALQDGDFEDAMQEMRHFISGSSGRIIGFHLGDR